MVSVNHDSRVYECLYWIEESIPSQLVPEKRPPLKLAIQNLPLDFLPDFEISPVFENGDEPEEKDLTPRLSTSELGRESETPTAVPGSPVSPRSPLLQVDPCPTPGLGILPQSIPRPIQDGVDPMAPPRLPLHEGYHCRGCDRPILGSRFKCMSR
jgi:hypothetical protein